MERRSLFGSFGIGFGLESDVAAVAAPINFHGSLPGIRNLTLCSPDHVLPGLHATVGATLDRNEASYRREGCARCPRRSPPRLIADDAIDSNILLRLIGPHSGLSSWSKVSIHRPRIGRAIGTSKCQQCFLQSGYRTPG